MPQSDRSTSALRDLLADRLGTTVFSAVEVHDMIAVYALGERPDVPGLWLLPRDTIQQALPRRAALNEAAVRRLPGPPPRAWTVEGLVHLACQGDEAASGFCAGRTLARGPQDVLQLLKQDVQRDDASVVVRTVLTRSPALQVEHLLSWHLGETSVRITTRVHNGASAPVTLELLSSFALGGVTPFTPDDGPDRLTVHRLRSDWSAEGRLVSTPLEDLNLERSWTGHGARLERFGQVGSMPVRGWFPFLAVEDTHARVTWGMQLAWAGSWQLELHRADDLLNVSGGLADRLFGEWWKVLQPGETFEAPEALLTVARGGIDVICDRLRRTHEKRLEEQPVSERDLPAMFNDYCSVWGDTSHDSVIRLADQLHGLPLGYLVIDAGWYRPDGSADWGSSHGDWQASPTRFPDGLQATADAIRARGFVPGLWFEAETVGRSTTAFSLTDHLLARDGRPITVGGRRFWDLCDPWVRDHLAERVIATLKACQFGYLKVDYNESLGSGCDGHGSPGEGLRRQIEGTYAFFEAIRAACPELVIENCASGGHRLEPSMLWRSHLSSFSDAHETPDMPIIAANVARLVPGGQALIWAVLHPDDSRQRLEYSLAATFLGRMCLSGNLNGMSAEQREVVRSAVLFQRLIWPLLGAGAVVRFGSETTSYRAPKGWQGLLRLPDQLDQALLVLHTFAQAPPTVEVPLPFNGSVTGSFGTGAQTLQLTGNRLTWTPAAEFCGAVVLLHRSDALVAASPLTPTGTQALVTHQESTGIHDQSIHRSV